MIWPPPGLTVTGVLLMIYAADRGLNRSVVPAGHGGTWSGMGAVVVGDDRFGNESERGGRSLRHDGSAFRRGVAPTWSGSP